VSSRRKECAHFKSGKRAATLAMNQVGLTLGMVPTSRQPVLRCFGRGAMTPADPAVQTHLVSAAAAAAACCRCRCWPLLPLPPLPLLPLPLLPLQ